MDELHVLSMGGVHKFSKTSMPFQKLWIQKSNIKEVQTLKYRHRLGVEEHMILKIPPVSVTSPRAASDLHPWGHLKCRVHMHFEGCTNSNPRLLSWKELNMIF